MTASNGMLLLLNNNGKGVITPNAMNVIACGNDPPKDPRRWIQIPLVAVLTL